MKVCHKCGTTVELEKVFRRDECPKCTSDLHVCLNCRFYDQTKANACMETQAEGVQEKGRANYCDYFSFRDAGAQQAGKETTRKLWDELFKKG